MCSISVAITLDFMVLWIGSITPLLLRVNHFGPILDAFMLTIAATGMENIKNGKVHHIPELDHGPPM